MIQNEVQHDRKIVEYALQDAEFSHKKRKRVPKRCWRHNDGHPNTKQDKKKLQEASAMKSSLFMTDMIKHFRDSTKISVHNVTSRPAAKTHQSIVQRYLGLWQITHRSAV